MANTLSEVINVLTQVKLATTIAAFVGIDIPEVFTTFENDATAAISAISNFVAPITLTNDITDAETAATAIAPLLQGTSLNNIINAIQGIAASASDLSSGQLAVLGSVTASFSGTSDKVIVAAYRESGTFAQIVDSGTTDTAVTNS